MNDFWVTKIDGNNFFKYKVVGQHGLLMEKDGDLAPAITLYLYWQNNSGEWELVHGDFKITVSLKTLMSTFIATDSPVEKLISELTEFKHSTQAKALEDSIGPFCVNSVEVNLNEHSDQLDMSCDTKVTEM